MAKMTNKADNFVSVKENIPSKTDDAIKLNFHRKRLGY